MNSPDKSQKTEQPTKRRLKQAREKGQISSSKDVVVILSMISIFVYFYIKGGDIWDTFISITSESTKLVGEPFIPSLRILYDTLQAQFISIIGPLIAIVILSVIIGHVIQFGFLLSLESIIPKLQKISPISGFKKIFSLKNFLEFVKSLLKVLVIVVVGDLIKIPECRLDCALPLLVRSITQTINSAVPIILFFAVIDVMIQKKLFITSQRMTKEETKRERKDDSGDPHIVSQRKALHKEIVSEGIQQIIENASLVIFDYGDQAVILHYDPESMPLPLIAMISRGAMTEKLSDLAREYKKPTLRDGTLVAELITHGRQGQYIPSECVEGVASALKNAG